jgi:hypothetical protein
MRIDAGDTERLGGVGAKREQKRGGQRVFHRTVILASDLPFCHVSRRLIFGLNPTRSHAAAREAYSPGVHCMSRLKTLPK